MATREHLAVAKAQATQRIEAVLPPSVVESWPTKTEERQIALLEYLAGVMERSSATKRAADKMTDAEKAKVEAAAAEKKAAKEAEKAAQAEAEPEAETAQK